MLRPACLSRQGRWTLGPTCSHSCDASFEQSLAACEWRAGNMSRFSWSLHACQGRNDLWWWWTHFSDPQVAMSCGGNKSTSPSAAGMQVASSKSVLTPVCDRVMRRGAPRVAAPRLHPSIHRVLLDTPQRSSQAAWRQHAGLMHRPFALMLCMGWAPAAAAVVSALGQAAAGDMNAGCAFLLRL